jgi:molybdopterin molybdotransferase
MSAGAPLAVEEARRLVLAEVVPSGAERVSLGECIGRVTAAAVMAERPVPPFDNSAMDGYAVRSADTEGAARPLAIAGESSAGHPGDRGPAPGEAMRISTGAMVPAGADAVVPLEQAREVGGSLLPTAAPVSAGAHVRRAGEDIAAGAEALPAGRTIGATELGVLASLGLEEVECARRPAVAVLTSGDELLGPGEAAGPGQIHDSNRFTLVAKAGEAGAEAVYAGLLPDEPRASREAIEEVLGSDLVVIAGGVSVGPHDHVKGALAELGVEQLFWRVALRPGGPTWAGVVRRPRARPTLVFGLPGNPVSAMVTFHLFVRPAILAATGRDPDGDRMHAALAHGYRKALGRAHYLRCALERGEVGWRASVTTERQGSHVLSSLLGAQCLAVIPAERTELEAGEEVEVRLL